MIDEWQAMLIAAPWAHQDAQPGAVPAIGVSAFDLGYVIWRIPPAGQPAEISGVRVVVDRQTGELTHWPSVPAEAIAERYRAYRGRAPVAPLTWDPLVQAEYERLRAAYPQNVTHLRLADGRLRIARSMKGNGTPHLHHLVRAALGEVPAGQRVRGGDRCSEVAALSDLLHSEDARRAAEGVAPLSAETARSELLRDADLATYQIREPGDPLGGHPAAPCGSCQVLLRWFGLSPPPAAWR